MRKMTIYQEEIEKVIKEYLTEQFPMYNLDFITFKDDANKVLEKLSMECHFYLKDTV